MKAELSKYQSTEQVTEYGTYHWDRIYWEDVSSTKINRVYRTYRVPVTCRCGSQRSMKLSDASRHSTALCHRCNAIVGAKDKYEFRLKAVQSKGDSLLESGAKVYWSHSEYLVRGNRRFSFVDVDCVCGKRSKVTTTNAASENYNGLCSKCARPYLTYLKHKANPAFISDGIYQVAHVARDEFGHEMASFRSDCVYALGTVAHHRLVMAQTLGRVLQSGEHVHHIDGDKKNNSPDNLMLVDARVHNAITKMEKKQAKRISILESEVARLRSELATLKV